jgi:hypothetical protein
MKKIIFTLSLLIGIFALKVQAQECEIYVDQHFSDSLTVIHAVSGLSNVDQTNWHITDLNNNLDTTFTQYPEGAEDSLMLHYQFSGEYIVNVVFHNYIDSCAATDTFYFGPRYQGHVNYEIMNDSLYIFCFDNSNPNIVYDEGQEWIITDLNLGTVIDSNAGSYDTLALPVNCSSSYRLQLYIYHYNNNSNEYEAGFTDTTITISPIEAYYYVTDATSDINCNGSIYIEVSGGSGEYNFNWSNFGNTSSNFLENVCPGTYEVAINDVNIIDQENCVVHLNDILVGLSDAYIEYVDTETTVLDTCLPILNIDSVYLGDVSFPNDSTFQVNWYFVSGQATFIFTQDYEFTNPGYYWLILGFNCSNYKAMSSYGRSVYVDPTITSISNISIAKAMIWPNPVGNNANITLFANSSTNGNLKVIDNTGRVVINKQISIVKGNNYYQLNTAKLSNGAYIISIKTDDGQIWNSKIVK